MPILAVGPQVVQERGTTRSSRSCSLFAVVLYIRVRFAEYSYGFAAVIALVHDVLVTLGALAIVIQLNIVNAQVSGHDRRVPDDHRLLAERHDRRVRPYPREPAPPGRQAAVRDVDLSINQTLARTVPLTT